MKKRENKKVLEIIKKESRINDLQKVIKHILISLFLIGLFLFILLIALSLIEITGFSTYIASKGGYITQVSISSSKTVDVWGGIYGLVLRVPNFTQQLNEELDSGGIERADIFFDCVKYDAEWGPEFYASTNASLDLSTSDVSSGTTEMIDEFINCSNEVFCANNTFTKNMTIFLGGTNITNIPSTFTYKFNGDNNIFDVGVLNVSGSLVFVSHINESIQQGFNPDFLVNYQMLLPTPANTTQTYYFYVDPDDECPSGGIGNGINANIYGYVFDSGSNPIENVTVNVAGYNGTTNSSGFYNFSTYVIEGNYNLIAQKSGYDPYLKIIGINFSNYILNRNITMETETPLLSGGTVNINVFGVVSDSAGSSLSDVNIYLGGSNATTNSTGHYSFNTTAITGINPIIAIKQNYNNYYALLNITNTSSLNHNITLESANLNDYPTGPYTENKIDDEEGDQKNKAKIESERRGEDFWISASEINKQVRENTFVEEKISIYNFGDSNMQVLFTISSNLEEIIKLDSNLLTISPDSSGDVTLTISGIKPVGVYKGTLTLSGDLESEIPVKIEIVSKKFSIENLLMKISLFKEEVKEGDSLKYELGLQNLLSEQGYKINLKHMILNSDESKIYLEEEESVEIKNSLGLLKEFNLPKNITKGKYLVRVEAAYLNYFSSINSPFTIIKPMYMYSFFGIPLWIIFVGISAFSFILLNGLLYRWQVQKRKRYHLALKIDTLPKQGNRSIKLGKIAEKKIPAYYNLDDLTTHAIVAGATGGGKSI
ncbi:MAG TPA: carboxypeptidase regulatory-like domain-containing protein, partial [Candidatus Pacearchaeota archaeon]|nr:carboxypeptidase regulatory-like domain-containing protein [Candidatus Pacearchaeota archaeon]